MLFRDFEQNNYSINSFTHAKTSPLSSSSSVHELIIFIIIIITQKIIREDRVLKFTIIDDAEEVQRIFVGYKYIERREEKKKKKSRFIRPKILSSPLLVLLVLVLVLL